MQAIHELLKKQEKYWLDQNTSFFGLSTLKKVSTAEEIQAMLTDCADRYWNNGTCEMKELLETKLCKDWNLLEEGSFELKINEMSMNIGLFANVLEPEKKPVQRLIATLPFPTPLGWIINGSEYVLRVAATPNYTLISKKRDTVVYPSSKTPSLTYKEGILTMKDDQKPLDVLDKHSKMFLSAVINRELTNDNVVEALEKMPNLDFRSVAYFNFSHTDAVFNVIRNSKRFANPLNKIPFDACTIMKSTDNMEQEDSFKHFVLAQSKLFSLENIRTCVFRSTKFNSIFHFVDTKNVFDSFKTSTNKSSGRSRLLLDDVTVRDGILYKTINGVEYNQYQLVLNRMLVSLESISCLSSTMFSQNNDPKRIMMSAKLRAQALPVEAEDNDLLHTVPARVVFGEMEGYNYGDSIIISESLARKLTAYKTDTIKLVSNKATKEVIAKYKPGDRMELLDLYKVFPGNASRVANYRDIHIIDINSHLLKIEAMIPFFVGDKITNFHASKGIVSVILPDEEMPYLENDIVVGDKVFQKGPFEIIISGLSVFRRKSMGQIFEAFALAMGIEDVTNVVDACTRYQKEMDEFSAQSVITFNGKKTIKPCGINNIIRLNHDGVTKQSLADIKANYKGLLKFEEMACLNLCARGKYDILAELDIRSVNKHKRSFANVRKMQETGKCVAKAADNLNSFQLIKALGYEVRTDAKIVQSAIDPRMEVLSPIATNDTIDLFDDVEAISEEQHRDTLIADAMVEAKKAKKKKEKTKK